MNFTEIENYLTKQERTVTGVKFEQGTDPLLNTDLVDVPESDNYEWFLIFHPTDPLIWSPPYRFLSRILIWRFLLCLLLLPLRQRVVA